MSGPIFARPTAASTAFALPLAACVTVEPARSEFDRHYREWREEQQSLAYSSRPSDYTSLPAFRAIVAMGTPVVPVIRAHLEQRSCDEDFFLASAVVEIRGWPRETAWQPSDVSEQALCRDVLRRLAAEAPVSRP